MSVNSPKGDSGYSLGPGDPVSNRVQGGVLTALIRAVRPKQATKNLFVYAALIFTGKLFQLAPFIKVTIGFLLFTAVAGGVYLLNDILDVAQDRLHPTKSRRPIASGQLSIPVAAAALLVLEIGGLMLGWMQAPAFGAAMGIYLLLQICYCFKLKHVVLLDVFTIAIGFVLRTVAGGLILNVSISNWLVLCSLQLALFLGFGKRRQELVLLGEEAGSHRAILQEYSMPFLDQMINIVSAVSIVCYSVYSVESDTAHRHPHLWITVPVVIYSVCRYLYLVYQKGWGGAPDDVLMKDRSLQTAILIWLALILLLFKFDLTGHPLIKY